jgi:transcriptional regulator with XRE-family HTH domain
MAKSLFLVKGNICADRVRLGRALQKPPMTQDDLARKMQLMGMEMTPIIISRIEKNQRHVCDAELRMLAKALGVSMDWLCGDEDSITLK